MYAFVCIVRRRLVGRSYGYVSVGYVAYGGGVPVTVWYTDVRLLTTGLRFEKCVVRPFRRCANVIQCTYANPDSTV